MIEGVILIDQEVVLREVICQDVWYSGQLVYMTEIVLANWQV